MTVSELLVAIRKPYVETLARQAAEGAGYVEPAYRNSDGSLAIEGVMAMPCRVDMIAREGAAAGEPVQVDAESELAFEPVGFAIEQMAVRISPFGWDWLALEVRGLSQEALVQVMGPWFLEWFDVEDENPPTEDALQGVVHFISDPEPTAEGFQLKIDLGSAPAPSLEDLLFALADAGATGAFLG